MAILRLFGTVTSPYVRRVRIVLSELSLDYQLVNTATDEGQRQLRAVTPVWKVPVLAIDDEILFDSHAITRRLLSLHPSRALELPDAADFESSNRLTAIDGALDSLINAFYLAKDGVGAESSSYAQKQRDRAATCLRWLDARDWSGATSGSGALGLPEVHLATALDWIRFRDVAPLEPYPELARVLQAHAARPSLLETLPC